jgi:CRP-like cAMP-binding protein
MKTHDLTPYIADHTFFEGMDDAHIELIAGCAKNVRFNAGGFVFRLGDDADTFFILRHGRVVLEAPGPKEESRRIQTLDEHDVLGWSWLFPPHRWFFDARALEMTRALALDGKCLRAKCEADHHLGYELMKRFSALVVERLQATRMQMIDIYE